MNLYISLFGREEDINLWIRLLDQEKIPYLYRGKHLANFSGINIIIGSYKEASQFFKTKKYFLIEPYQSSKNNAISGNSYPKIIKKNNILFLSENISSSKRKETTKILQFLRCALQETFWSAGLPYIHIWYYPENIPTIFLFRQDIDYIDKESIEGLSDVLKKYGVKTTYFVNISGEEEFDERIGHLKLKKPTTPKRAKIFEKANKESNEIANHGYWHYVFPDYQENYQNIKKCSLYLKKLFKIKDVGYASPGAEWNKQLAKSIDKLGYLYSCCTLSNSNGFPYYPSYAGKKSKTLEVSFYKLSDASFENLKENSNLPRFVWNNLRDDYLDYIDRQMATHEPIAILGHPHILGLKAKKFLPSIFQKIKKNNIPSYTIQEFANWWKKRGKFNFKFSIGKGKIFLESDKPCLIEIVKRRKSEVVKLGRRLEIVN